MFRRKGGGEKVVVLGLDGAPYTMIKQLAEDGVMPNMRSIINKGNFYQMNTSIPEISSVAWTTFMTGKNPGEHAIFGFTDLAHQSYRLRFPNFADLKSPPLWEEIEKENKRTVVINLPSTYPAKPIKGILISGFVALWIEKASYPERIVPFLKSIGYRIDVDTLKAQEDKNFLLKDLRETLNIREKAIAHFWDEENWDLFIAVVTGTDRLQHFLMDAYSDRTHQHHQSFLDYYNQVDCRVVKRINERIDRYTHLIVMSDHGFTPIEKEVYLNRWLLEEGYVKFKSKNPETIEDIDEGTRIFVLDPGRFYVNMKDRYPSGTIVSADEYNELLDEIISKLELLEYKGKKVIDRVFRREELYSGPYAGQGPDLVARSNYGFDLKGNVKSKKVFGNSFLVGMHTQDDAFVIVPEGTKFNAKPHISQIKDIILRLIG